MLTWLYELLISFVSFILGLFGIQMNKKSVSFADDVEKKEVVELSETKVDNVAVTDPPTESLAE
jgi:hypothetical protein